MCGSDERPRPDELDDLLDLVAELVAWLRVGTFDEAPGERETQDRAHDVLARYRRAE